MSFSDDIQKLAELERAATNGPWRPDFSDVMFPSEDGEFAVEVLCDEDAKYIVHARNTVPQLLAFVREARELIGGMDDALEVAAEDVYIGSPCYKSVREFLKKYFGGESK